MGLFVAQWVERSTAIWEVMDPNPDGDIFFLFHAGDKLNISSFPWSNAWGKMISTTFAWIKNAEIYDNLML